MEGKRSQRHEKLARLYDEEILPLWTQRFARMMLRGLVLPARAMILDVGCGTGYLSLELLRRLDDAGRIIAIDGASALLDVARRKAGPLGGKRIFFRTESSEPRLPFAADVYDLVVSNLGLGESADPQASLAEYARVAKPGGQVIASLPLAGTWGELHDIYREVLVKHDKHELLERLDHHLRRFPEVDELERWMAAAGLEGHDIEVEEFQLLFKSSREFFFAPVVEFGPLVHWKEIAGKGQELQDVFWYIKQSIDAYFAGRAFEITVKAACLRGRKRADAVVEVPAREAEAAPPPEDTDPGAKLEEPEEIPDEDVELEAFRDETTDRHRRPSLDDGEEPSS